MKRNLQGIIAGALLIAAAAANAAGPTAAPGDTQYAWFLHNLELTDGAPVPALPTPAASDTQVPRTVWSTPR